MYFDTTFIKYHMLLNIFPRRVFHWKRTGRNPILKFLEKHFGKAFLEKNFTEEIIFYYTKGINPLFPQEQEAMKKQ